MGNTLKSIKDSLYSKEEVRLLMCGLDAAGKTTILYKLKLGEIVTTIPIIGFNVESVDCKSIHITSWDVGGRCRNMRPLWRHYYQYQKINCLVFVVDSNDRERISQCTEELQRMACEDELKNSPILVLANKQDLPNAMSVEEITEKLELHKLRDHQWYIQGSTATNGDGLYEGLDWLRNAVTNKAMKESAVKPIKETANSDTVQKPRSMFSSIYNSLFSHFTPATS